jgi:formylglycine-generating enzyme required for sulfatase activity
MTSRDPLQINGTVVAEKYRIERLVGEGGFAVVYRAIHTIWNKPVAIKFFNGLSAAPVDQRDDFHQAFIQEGALLTELSSHTAAIVQARDVGTYTSPDGQWMPYLVLEWLDGAALDAVLEREHAAGLPPWSLAEVHALLGQVAGALDVVHGKGIAHRDVKPANLFVLGSEPRAGRATVKLLDFGVAKLMSDNTQLKAALAKTGMALTSFTPQYGAPEQFSRSYGATGPWTDVFALALVITEMLTGRSALEGDDVVQLGFSTGNPERRPTPRTLGAAVPDAVEAVFNKALAVKPHDRYARASEFWSDFSNAIGASPGVFSSSRSPLSQPPGNHALAAATELAPSTQRATESTTGGSAQTALEASGPRRGVLVGLIATAAIAGAAFAFLGSARTPGTPASSAAPVASVAPLAPPSAVASAAPKPPECPPRSVKIEAGQYFQGSDAKDALDNEKPSHNVALSAYCIDLYEVTAKEYKACSDIGKCRRLTNEVHWPKITPAEAKTYAPLCTFGKAEFEDHPINCIGWETASDYCKTNGKRLPTEAEWEYATRGPDGRVYPWGDDPPTSQHLNACGKECVAWGQKQGTTFAALYPEDDGYPNTSPVGKFEAGRSRFGPYDVAGNVWEWVSDWYAPYTTDEKKNPAGPGSGDKKVIRGGAWNGGYASWLRPSFRYAQIPEALSYGIGFRCAKSLD